MAKRHEIRAVDMHTELHVIGFVIENPSVYLSEVCYNIRDITGEAVSPFTVCRLLKRYGISRKKIRQVGHPHFLLSYNTTTIFHS